MKRALVIFFWIGTGFVVGTGVRLANGQTPPVPPRLTTYMVGPGAALHEEVAPYEPDGSLRQIPMPWLSLGSGQALTVTLEQGFRSVVVCEVVPAVPTPAPQIAGRALLPFASTGRGYDEILVPGPSPGQPADRGFGPALAGAATSADDGR